MNNEQKHAQEVSIKQKQAEYELQRKRDKAINESLDFQNDRLQKLITNYRLTKKWNRIQLRERIIEKLKIWKVFYRKQKPTPPEAN